MTKDNLLHYLGGHFMALPWRFFGRRIREERVTYIDYYGFDREWEQNFLGENPNIPMSAHQLTEACAWGIGARAALGVDPPRPPEYAVGQPL